MNKTKRNSGFSIMETVIALAIIVMVTLAALTVIMTSISARVKATNYGEAQDFAHNILECFKAADENSEFESYVGFAGYTMSVTSNNKYYFENNKFTAQIDANCSSGEFEITINDTKNEEIISFSYTKGAK